MKFLAIDPSLTRTGIAYGSGEKAECVSISSKPTDGISETERISTMANKIMSVVEHVDPDVVAIESALVGTGHGVSIGVLFLQGILRNRLFYRILVPVVEIHSSQRRKYACGDQKERDKDNILLSAREAAGADVVHNNDEADAWWMWRIVADAYESRPADPQDLTLYRQEVLAKLDLPEVGGYRPEWVAPKKPKKRKASTVVE